MNYQMIEPNVVCVDAQGRKLCFSFFGENGLRFFDLGADESYCVDKKVAKPLPLKATELPNALCLEHGPIRAFVDEKLSIRVSVNNVECFVGHLGRASSDRGGDYSLAEKEGHHQGEEEYAYALQIENGRPVYGLGERTGPLDKRGYDYIDWNTDDPSAHVDTFKSLYQSIPFFVLFGKERSVGVFFDNTSKTHFDFNKQNDRLVQVEFNDGFADFYLFFGSLKEVCGSYSRLTGRSKLPPYWTLGAQQCRWSYPSKEKVEEVIHGYQEADIPLSCVYLDIDYMVDYKDFSIDAAKFPDTVRWLRELKEKDIHIVPIIDAGVKAEEGYDVYDEGVANGYFCTLNGTIYHNEVWPGDSVFPAFLDERVQQWWGHHIARLLELGFDGIWNDMNEPASFKGPLPLEVKMGKGVEHRFAHNVYAHHMVKGGALGFELANKRLFQVTRAGYAGTCAYATSWAGDNQSIYDHLRLMLPQMMNMSLSGQAYIGVDIGGFGGDTTPELLTKWAVAALLNPLYRNHSALGTKDQEPYQLKGKYLEAYCGAVMMRYELLPSLYTELYFAEHEGSCPLRPLIYNYPDDERLQNENQEIMLGENILLAPSLFPGESKRHCYFPEEYVHYPSLQVYAQGDHIIDVDIGDIPIFFRKKGMVLLSKANNKEAKQCDELRLYWGGADGVVYYYEDEGDGLAHERGVYNLYQIVSLRGQLSVHLLHGGMKPICHQIHVFGFRETNLSLIGE